jgi:hypothetical protein
MESIFKMATLHLSIRPSESCIFDIFKPTIFKFWMHLEVYIRINDTFGFFASFSISSEIEPFKLRFFYYSSSVLRMFPIPLKFRVYSMIYFGSSNHKKKLNGEKKQNGRQNKMNFPQLSQSSFFLHIN